MMVDERFPEWEPVGKFRKGELLMHLDYAHKAQSRRDSIHWLDSNYLYFYRKYSVKELLEIHKKYHDEVKV